MTYALFDMDGTLLDSMVYWRSLHMEYLTALGDPRLSKEYIAGLSRERIRHAFARVENDTGIRFDREKVGKEMLLMMGKHYLHDISPFPVMRKRLEELFAAGVPMGVVTATPHAEAEEALRHAGLSGFFRFVLTEEDNGGLGKSEPSIFRLALRRLGCENPADCTMYDDALYSLRTAKALGLRIAAVLDPSGRAEWGEMVSLADEVIDAQVGTLTKEQIADHLHESC